MRENSPSRTADRVAIRRAAHQLLDSPLVLDDPLATRVLDAAVQATLRADPRHYDRSPLASHLRAFMAVRSRFAEDRVAAGVARGVEQYVVLGAGLDTFAYRNPFPQLAVCEVDHPATQRWKQERLAAAGIAIPPNVQYLAIDFERDALIERLPRLVSVTSPTCFSWLGVTPYLDRAMGMATLTFVARAFPPGSEIVFDYAIDPALLSIAERAMVAFMARRVRAAGEPWIGFFDPLLLTAELRRVGFADVEDLDGSTINARYFAGRADRLRVGNAAHLMRATV